ncbi:TPA: tape measure protein [Salmonella enterica]|nr:tape measure protein [Salmonella enterica]
MADNSVTVEIKDGVASSIPTKIDRIAASARTAHTAVEKLQQQVNMLNGNGLERLNSAVNNSASALSRLSQAQSQQNSAAQQAILQQQRLATETARTATQQQRLQTESAKTATQQARLSTETQRTTTQTQRLATETQRTAAAQANAATAAIRQQQAQARLDQTLNGSSRAASNASGSLALLAKQYLSLAAAAVAAKQALDLATTYTVVNNKIKTVTESVGQQETLLKRLTQTALETSTGIDVVSQAFIRFDRPMAQMGKSQEETLRLITTINKELANTGATTSEAASAVLQLGQAFGSGLLQGDEFRSLAENMPTLLDAVAKAMGVTRGEVKQLGSDGKITSDILLKALTDMQAKTDETYAKTAQTVPQAMQNVKTSLTIAIGEMDKALGVTSNLAKGLNFLAQNMGIVGVAATVLGVALLAVFGAPLLAALGAATSAVISFTVALASNPIGLIAVAISGAIAYIIAFGDEIKVIEGGMITLKDVALAVWDYIKEAVGAVADFAAEIWNWAIEQMKAHFDVLSKAWGDTNISIGDIAKAYVNFVIGFWVAAYNTIKTIWNNFPAFMDVLFVAVVNAAATAAEKVINSWQIGLRAIASAATNVAPDVAEKMNAGLDAISIKLPRAKASAAGAQLAKDLGDGIRSATSVDYVGKAYNAVLGKALTHAVNRSNAAAGDPLRGSGVNTLKKADDDAKKGKTKKPKKEPAAKLTDEQKAYKKALDELKKPQLDFEAAVSVSNDLLAKGAINQERYTALIAKATDEYMKATNPMYSFTKAAIEQYDALQKVGVAHEAETQVIQARNQALQAGLPFTEAMAEQIRKTVDALDMQQRKYDALNQIWEETEGKQRTLLANQQAYNEALANGSLNAEQYSIKMAQLNAQQAQLNMQMGSMATNDALVAGLGQFVANYQGVMQGLSDSWAGFFQSFTDGFADSIGRAIVYGDDLGESLKSVAQQAMAELISSFVKLGIQYVVNAALAKTAMATTTAMGATAAAATAAAWSPAAAMVSLASFGTNAVGANLGIASTVAIAKGLSAISGFKTGGFTGNIGVDEVAGVVHGKEFVVNASATKKYRPMLEAMNNGSSPSTVAQNAQNAGSGGGGGTYVTFQITNEINVEGGAGDTDAEALEKAATAISNKTQGDIMESIRSGGVWKNVIKATVS